MRPSLTALIRTYGLLELTRILAARGLDRLSAGAAGRFFFRRAMRAGCVYFGEHLGARQGVLRRHSYMYRLARQEVARHDAPPFRVLEVGSYAGASAITWALAIQGRPARTGTVTCVDPWRNYLDEDDIRASATPEVLRAMAAALEQDEVLRLFEHNVRAAGVESVVRPLRGGFAEIAPSLAAESFDVVYIDASHRYADVLADLQRAGGLVRPAGILCGDDLEQQWPAVDQEYCHQRLQHDFIVDPRTRRFVHPGVTKAVWDFFGHAVSAWNGFWAMRKPPSGTWQEVELDPALRSELPPHLQWSLRWPTSRGLLGS